MTGNAGWRKWTRLQKTALAFGVVEMTTLDLLFLMLALGALVAAVVAGAGLGIIGQILVFLAASALLVLALRPIDGDWVERDPRWTADPVGRSR